MSRSEFDTPPLPKCPNCGASIAASGAYCPNCGYGRTASRSSNSCLQVLLVVFFAAIVLPIAAVGACFLILANGEMGSIAVGIGALILAGLVVYLMIRAVKSA